MRRILGQTLQKPKTVTGSRGCHRFCGCWAWGSPEPSQLPLCRDQTLTHNLSGIDRCQKRQIFPWNHPSLVQHCHSPRGASVLSRGLLQSGTQGSELKCNLLRGTSKKPLSEPCPRLQRVDVLQEHITCVWADIWDICGEAKSVKSIVLKGLDPSRENWLQPWLVKWRLWGLEAFSLQFENPCCVKLFNTYDSTDFKVDNHHWALNTQSLLLELQLFFVNTNIKYLFWIRII